MTCIYSVILVFILFLNKNGAIIVGASSLRQSYATATEKEESNQNDENSNRELLSMTRPVKESRIVGGSSINPGEFPSFVHWDFGCGGSLIYEDIVLSAAHCYYLGGRNKDKVFVGPYRRQEGIERTITEYVPHPLYESEHERNDFIILKLDSPVDGIGPIPLNSDRSFPTNNDPLTVVGFGATYINGSPATLQQVNVDYIPFDTCETTMRGVRDDMNICAGGGGRDACIGDSGGPLYSTTSNGQQRQQVGVVSWGRGCGLEYFPGIYSRVSYAYEWIQNQICMHSSNPPSECVSIIFRFENDSNQHQQVIQWSVRDGENVHIMHESTAFSVLPGASLETSITLIPGTYLFNLNELSGNPTIEGEYIIFREEADDVVLITDGTPEDGIAVSFDVLDNQQYQQQQQQQQIQQLQQHQHQQHQQQQHQQQQQQQQQQLGPNILIVSTPVGDLSTTADVVVEIHFDNYPNEISWSLQDVSNGSIIENVDTGDYVWFEYGGKTTQTSITIEKGKSYRYTIKDLENDGICCSYGPGYFTVSVGDHIITSGDEFGPIASVNFVVS